MEPFARAYLDFADFDAITVNPYLGSECLAPVFDAGRKGLFLLSKTSNPGSGEIQNLELANGQPLFAEIAAKVVEWNVTSAGHRLDWSSGATYPAELLQSARGCSQSADSGCRESAPKPAISRLRSMPASTLVAAGS